jgi:hypothetical protein|tara:strand:+ start:249 stop:497 length:249 start_codon:yes stop_codon:yes gene_type:complete
MKLTKKRLKQIIKEELIRERDWDKVPVPSVVKRFQTKFIDALKGANLTRIKQVAVLYRVIDALGLSTQELVMYIQKIKRDID